MMVPACSGSFFQLRASSAANVQFVRPIQHALFNPPTLNLLETKVFSSNKASLSSLPRPLRLKISDIPHGHLFLLARFQAQLKSLNLGPCIRYFRYLVVSL